METRELCLCSCEDGMYWMQIIVVLTVSNAGGPVSAFLGQTAIEYLVLSLRFCPVVTAQ